MFLLKTLTNVQLNFVDHMNGLQVLPLVKFFTIKKSDQTPLNVHILFFFKLQKIFYFRLHSVSRSIPLPTIYCHYKNLVFVATMVTLTNH